MKQTNKNRAVLAGICGIIIATALHAAPTAVSDKAQKPIRKPLVDPVLAAQMAEVEKLPTIEADAVPRRTSATYYSAQNLLWPPLPANFNNLPLWDLGDGHYLISDLDWDYSTPATTTSAMAMNSSLMTLDSDGGGVTMNELTQSGVPYLTVVQTGTNTLLITVINDASPVNYEIWTTPMLANPAMYPWTLVTNGIAGQTNFTVNIGPYPTGFYRAVWDTNGIPLWQMADPQNPGGGVLKVFIDSPTNGAVVL